MPKQTQKNPPKLTPKENLFKENLIKRNFNQKKAYRDTYPDSKDKSSESNGSRKVKEMIRNDKMTDLLDKAQLRVNEFLSIKTKKFNEKKEQTKIGNELTKRLVADKSETDNRNPDKLVIIYDKQARM